MSSSETPDSQNRTTFTLLVQVHVFLDTLEMRSNEGNRMYLVRQYKVLMSSYWTWYGAFKQNSSICIRNGPFSLEISADRNISELRLFPLGAHFIAFNLWQILFWQHSHQLDVFLPEKKKSFLINILMLISHHIAWSKLWRMWYVCLSSKRKLRKKNIYICLHQYCGLERF